MEDDDAFCRLIYRFTVNKENDTEEEISIRDREKAAAAEHFTPGTGTDIYYNNVFAIMYVTINKY